MRHLRLVHCTERSASMRLKIAFASSDRTRVDQHFGAAGAFAIYAIDPGAESRLVAVAEFHDRDVVMDGHEGKLAGKIALLEGCAAVYCNAVGASAIRQLLAAGIQPMKVEEGTAIDAILRELGESLAGEPPAWMARHLHRGDSDRFAAMAAEGWSE